MTPLSKMVTVSLNTGVGECMELMRRHQIRHLPVMATETGEDRNQALQNLKSVAERGEASARKQFTPYKAKLKDAFGDDEGMQAFAALSADPDAYVKDPRPLLQRAATAAAKLKLAEERLAAVSEQNVAMQARTPIGCHA